MDKAVLSHALAHDWCNPTVDNIFVMSMKRLSTPSGSLNRFTGMGKTRKLPQQGTYYQVFHIGFIYPSVMNLIEPYTLWAHDYWYRFDDTMNKRKIQVHLYTDNGVVLPRFNSYYMFTSDGALLVAIPMDSSIKVDYSADDVYMKLYSNSFFNDTDRDLTNETIECQGLKITYSSQIYDFMLLFQGYQARHGFVVGYVNGVYTDRLTPQNMQVGDTVELVYDSTVKERVAIQIKDLHNFQSQIDTIYKYLFTYDASNRTSVNYVDDCEVYLVRKEGVFPDQGLYYHYNRKSNHRMVTHRDWSLDAGMVESVATGLMNLLQKVGENIEDYYVTVMVRDTGVVRQLNFEDSRIHDLYKLPYETRVAAMVGVDSTVPFWRAEALEASKYVEFLSRRYDEVQFIDVQQAYGYNALSVILGNSPKKPIVSGAVRYIDLEVGQITNSTCFEYDANGRLLESHYHDTGETYIAQNINTRLVEVLPGKGDYLSHDVYGQTGLALPAKGDFRVYMCFLNEGVPDNEWVDITNSDFWHREGNQLVWDSTDTDHWLMVRTMEHFVQSRFDLEMSDGNFTFILSEGIDTGSGIQNTRMYVPRGDLDVFLNKRPLIRGLDFVVHFPYVTILNLDYLVQPASSTLQEVEYRFTGFCTENMELDRVEDYGFIQHGVLSNNTKYDIRDDKVLMISVDGSLRHRDDLLFSENTPGVSVVNALNGKPYQIKDRLIPMSELVDTNTYQFRTRSEAMDKVVSDYMTLKYPQPPRNAASSIARRYPLVSPFFARLINALETEITDEQASEARGDNEIMDLCAPYMNQYAWDPLNEDLGINPYDINVNPHHNNGFKTLSYARYLVLSKAMKIYGQGRIDLSNSVNFST